VKVWNAANWTCERVIEAHKDSIWALQVCNGPDGEKLFSASVDTSIQVWDMDTWTLEHTLRGHHGPVYALTSLGGKVMSGSDDETMHVWGFDAETNEWKSERMLRSKGVWSLIYFNDRLVSGLADHNIKVFC